MNLSAVTKLMPLPAFQDNYIWLLVRGQLVVAVDPGSASVVEEYLQLHDLILTHILVTHHHADHTGGVQQLLDRHPQVQLIAPQHHQYGQHPHTYLSDGEKMPLTEMNWSCTAIHTPGHTLDHVCYWLEETHHLEAPILFSGDTLFAGGCGRLFEGSAEQMWHSLHSLRKLPPSTRVCAAHEYTLANLEFACHYANQDPHFSQRFLNVKNLRNLGLPTLPSSIEEESKSNVFLRADDDRLKSIWQSFGLPENANPIETFSWLRQAKNHFPSC